MSTPGYADPEVTVNPDQVITDDLAIEYLDTYAFGGEKTFVIQKHPRTGEALQFITFSVMNEGQKTRYQKATNRDIRIDRKTDQAMFSADVAADRQALIRAAVVDWRLYRVEQTRTGVREPREIRFSPSELDRWLMSTNPRIVEDLELAIRKANPWLITDDATEEELEEQIAELNELLVQKRLADREKA